MHESKAKRNGTGDRMNNRIARSAVARLLRTAGALAAFAPGLARADWEWNFQPPVSAMAEQIVGLHEYIMWICVAIFVGVFGVMFYSLFKHRKSVGHQAVQFHENTTVEVIWTIIPLLILALMAWPATKTIIAAHDTAAPDMTVKVTRSEEGRVGKE